MVNITIPTMPITKKNSQQILINTATGRPFISPSKQYKQYLKDCSYFLREMNIDYPINLKTVFYMPTKRKVDLTNLLSSIHDVLVAYKVIVDDNSTVVVSVDGSEVCYDKENPRTEITITRK